MSEDYFIMDKTSKTFFKYSFEHFLGLWSQERYTHLYEVVQMLLHIPQVNNLEKVFGVEETNKLLKSIGQYNVQYNYVSQIRGVINKLNKLGGNREALEVAYNRLYRVCASLPVIHIDLLRVFWHLVQRTDLQGVQLNHANIQRIKLGETVGYLDVNKTREGESYIFGGQNAPSRS